jgi:hypothetical protein
MPRNTQKIHFPSCRVFPERRILDPVKALPQGILKRKIGVIVKSRIPRRPVGMRDPVAQHILHGKGKVPADIGIPAVQVPNEPLLIEHKIIGRNPAHQAGILILDPAKETVHNSPQIPGIIVIAGPPATANNQ